MKNQKSKPKSIIIMILIGFFGICCVLYDALFNACNNLNIIGYVNILVLTTTAIIVYWYADQTYRLRDIEEKKYDKISEPILNSQIELNNASKDDLFFWLINTSNQRLSCIVNIVYVMKYKGNSTEEEKIHFEPYNGSQLWNLQYKETKKGHFRWTQLISGFDEIMKDDENRLINKYNISEEDLRSNSDNYQKFMIEFIQKEINFLSIHFTSQGKKLWEAGESNLNIMKDFHIILTVDIYSFNEDGLEVYYPPVTYNWKPFIGTLIPRLTSEKACWGYNELPAWIKENKYYIKYIKKEDK
jgi:hypothetical protein